MATVSERKEPRFNTATTVVVALDGRQQLQEMWTANISKGGLFVVTKDPPPMHTKLVVTLETPDGELSLAAEVVHVVPPGSSGFAAAGVGLQFTQLSSEKRTAVQRYVDGVAAQLNAAPAGGPQASRVNMVMNTVRAVLTGLDAGSVFAALQAPLTSTAAELRQRHKAVTMVLAHVPDDATPAQVTRIQSAQRVMDKLLAMIDALPVPAPATAPPPAPDPAPAPRMSTAAHRLPTETHRVPTETSRIPTEAYRLPTETHRVPTETHVPIQKPTAPVEEPTGPTFNPGRTAKARALARLAAEHAERLDYAVAEETYEQAIKLDSGPVAFHVALAWVVAQNPVRSMRDRLEIAFSILQGLFDHYDVADVPYTAGMVCNLQGKKDDAARFFERALELDPSHAGALRMMRLLQRSSST